MATGVLEPHKASATRDCAALVEKEPPSEIAEGAIQFPLSMNPHVDCVERLDRFDAEEGWKEVLVEDRTCTPAELAASLSEGRLPKRTWLLFHDRAFFSRWLGLYDDTPRPREG